MVACGRTDAPTMRDVMNKTANKDHNHKDLRTEQVKLLRFEKAIEAASQNLIAGKPLDKAPVLASLSALAASAAAVSAKLGSDAPLRLVAEAQAAAAAPVEDTSWLLSLAEAASTGHALLEGLAQEGAFQILQAGGGTPKTSMEAVTSLLANGPF